MLNVEILKQLIDFAETDEKMHPNTVNMCEIIKKYFSRDCHIHVEVYVVHLAKHLT